MKWFEIFKTGTHTDSAGNTKEWTPDELKTIAKNYNPGQYEAPLVIGHPETNAPAYGWVESLKFVGNKLLAKASQIAPEFIELFRKGSFKKISVALTPNLNLRHIGFLGAAAPAVEGLKTADFSANTEDILTFESDNESVDNETVEILFTSLNNLEDKFNALVAQIVPLFSKEGGCEADGRFAAASSNFSVIAENKTASGNLTPAQKTLLLEITNSLNPTNKEFSSDKTLSLLSQLVELLPVQVGTSHFAKKLSSEPPTAKSELQSLAQHIAESNERKL